MKLKLGGHSRAASVKFKRPKSGLVVEVPLKMKPKISEDTRDYLIQRYNKIKFMKRLIDNGQKIVLTAKDRQLLFEYQKVIDGEILLPNTGV